MIRNFKHRGLKTYHERGTTRYLNADHVAKIRSILHLLDVAAEPRELGIPALRLHPLKGEYKGFWAISVSDNRRIIFRFEDGDACDVELIDHH